MKNGISLAGILSVFLLTFPLFAYAGTDSLRFYPADDSFIHYTGRVSYGHPKQPRFWMPGVYITTSFGGTACEVLIHDEERYGSFHNYLEIVVDGKASRIQTSGKINRITVANNLEDGIHTLVICKNTESGIGYLDFGGIFCRELIDPGPKPQRKLEFIGNSITCGTGADQSQVACGKGVWHDQHNAYMSYGPLTARALDAQWQLSAVSGIGVIRSCCNLPITMPQVFDKVNMREDTLLWDFSAYQPDVVTICLGQNDGIQDSAKFCTAYLSFIDKLRKYYPQVTIICLASPMADPQLNEVLRRYLNAIVEWANVGGRQGVYPYFFKKQYNGGCDDHPDLEQHQLIANELVPFIRRIMVW